MSNVEAGDRETLQQGEEWVEMGRKSSLGDQKQSRFHVAKVDFASDSPAKRNKYPNSDHDSPEAQPLTDPDHASIGSGRNVGSADHHTFTYDTHNVRSLRHYTREALPRADHYRNVMSVHGQLNRPTLEELHNPSLGMSPDSKYSSKRFKNQESSRVLKSGSGATKFGWIQGVLVRCLLNIWGVMLFLRLSWVVGQAGIGLGSLVVLLATCVTLLTTVSMSAICTNGEVRGGGTYYMISRSLGPEFGGAIGLIFALANAVAVAMYVVGFSETLTKLLMDHGLYMTDGGMNDIRIIGCITILVLFCIAIIGTEWEAKAQIGLLVILLISMCDFVIGTFIPPNERQKSQGYIGWDLDLIAENFGPDFRGETFISVFSVYFPAATGILAGANISGDLADPQGAIPKGTFLAIVITTLTYLWFAFSAGAVVLRDANGIVSVVVNGTLMIRNCSLTLNDTAVTGNITIDSAAITMDSTATCKYGLMNYYEVMEMVSVYGPIVYAGIFAATLSSALASLVSAPKVFQALCKDKLFPHIDVFAKGYGKSGEPRRAYCLAFVIALGCIAIGELNSIAPIISNFFLAAYCLINFSCFHASFARSPGFRPAFKYYNMWLSLLGALVCLCVMFIMNWWTALLTFALVLGLYIFIHYRKPDVNWGSSTQAQTYKNALNSVFKLNLVQEHVKNYRPQLLVLSGSPSDRPPLVDFAYQITKKLSLMVCGHVVNEMLTERIRNGYSRQADRWLQKRKVKAFYALVEDEKFSRGVRSLIQLVGVGKLKPNVLFMGYKGDWQTCDKDEVEEYFNTIHEAFDKHLSLGILRLPEGLDYSQYNDIDEMTMMAPTTNGKKARTPSTPLKPNLSENNLPRNPSSVQLSQECGFVAVWLRLFSTSVNAEAGSSRESTPPSTPATERANSQNASTDKPEATNSQVVHGLSKDLPKDVLSCVNQFQRKQKKGTIDVWWLYDDGGLTILLPYLLTTHAQWNNCKLRVFSLANKKDELDREQRNMAALLSKFRIDYSDVMVIPDITKPPQDTSKQDFEKLISQWRVDEESEEDKPGAISATEMLAVKDKTNRHIRLRELLLQYSRDASVIVMTLPMPRKGTCSAPMYMAWLETLTRDMPPFLLIRGNQTSVLTFYS